MEIEHDEAVENTGEPTGTVLLRFSVLVDGSTAGSLDSTGTLLAIHQQAVAAITEIVGKVPGQLGWVKTDFTQLDDPDVNSGHCAVCSMWVTDCEESEPLQGLPNGATVEGQLLCEQHLPPDHPWAD